MAACLPVCCACGVASRRSNRRRRATGRHVEFLPALDFHLSANALALATDDQRFTWDALLRRRRGPLRLRRRPPVDPRRLPRRARRRIPPLRSQPGLLRRSKCRRSYRLGETEIAGVVPSRVAASQRSAEAVRDRLERRAARACCARVDSATASRSTCAPTPAAIVQHAYVDYSWTADVDLDAPARTSTRASGVFAHGSGETVHGRSATCPTAARRRAAASKAGVRIDGRAGALELFAGGERRLDADPLDRADAQLGRRRLPAAEQVSRLNRVRLGIITLPWPAVIASSVRASSASPARRSCVRARDRDCRRAGAAAPARIPDRDAAQRPDGRARRGSLHADRPRCSSGITSARRTKSPAAPASRISSST